MRFAFAQGQNRWFIAFSSVFMVVFAVLAGVGRMVCERMSMEWGSFYAPEGFVSFMNLSMIVLLLIAGMVANAVLTFVSFDRRWFKVCLISSASALCTLGFTAMAYGGWLLRLFSHSVSGGD